LSLKAAATVIGDFNVTTDKALDLAGMSNGRSPWPITDAYVPADLRIEGEVLRYVVMGGADAAVVVPRPVGMLAKFMRITDEQGVLDFANAYGVLGICEHGLPASHQPFPAMPRSVEFGRDACMPVGYPSEVAEPVSRWLDFARQARALLSIGALLLAPRRRWPGKDYDAHVRDWATVLEGTPSERDQLAKAIARDRDASRLHLTWYVNRWLMLGDVRPSLHWTQARGAPSLGMGGLGFGGTFGLLAVDLAVGVSRSHELSMCDGCKYPYLREGRKAKAGQRNYCPDCRSRGIPARDRKRDERAGLGRRVRGKARAEERRSRRRQRS
jgi:hypothetical protein